MNTKTKLIISVTLVVLGVACRLLPHFWNFAPIAAIALFAGAYLGKKYALILPVIAMLVGDIFIGFYEWQMMLAVYGSFSMVGLIGYWVGKNKSLETVVGASIISSIIFFLATNFAVWQFGSWYASSLQGLLEAYTLALPFFRNTMLGDLFYTSVLFGAYEAVSIYVKSKKVKFSLSKSAQ